MICEYLKSIIYNTIKHNNIMNHFKLDSCKKYYSGILILTVLYIIYYIDDYIMIMHKIGHK